MRRDHDQYPIKEKTHDLKPAVGESAAPNGLGVGGSGQGRIGLLDDAGEIGHAEGGEQFYGLLVDLDEVSLDGGLFGDEVHAALALLLLELEGDAADWAPLDALHEVGGEAGDLVAEALRGDDGHLFQDLLVRVEVERHARVVPLDHQPRRFLHRLRANATHLLLLLLLLEVAEERGKPTRGFRGFGGRRRRRLGFPSLCLSLSRSLFS